MDHDGVGRSAAVAVVHRQLEREVVAAGADERGAETGRRSESAIEGHTRTADLRPGIDHLL